MKTTPIKYLIVFLIIPCAFAAMDVNKIHDKENDKLDLVIESRNLETGVYDSYHHTSRDHNKFGGGVLFNADLFEAQNILGWEFSYGYRIDITWLKLFISQNTATFDEIAKNHTTLSFSENAEFNFQRNKETNSYLLNGGIGLGYRFRVLTSHFNLKANRLFETVSAYFTLNQFRDDLRSLNYYGPGLKAEYELNKRVSTYFYYGLKFNYNLANVRRSELTVNEISRERNFSLAWTNFIFQLGFIY